jgi:predicted MPP superfamily phosphohydrolase
MTPTTVDTLEHEIEHEERIVGLPTDRPLTHSAIVKRHAQIGVLLGLLSLALVATLVSSMGAWRFFFCVLALGFGVYAWIEGKHLERLARLQRDETSIHLTVADSLLRSGILRTDRGALALRNAVERAANQLAADLVVVTGDLVDKRECIPWIPAVLGKLESRYGNFCVLGNHDLRVGDLAPLRAAIAEAGFVDLGGAWRVLTIHGVQVALAGNELPWLAPAAEMADCPVRASTGGLRILLSHSPDQLEWARRHDFDLVLAGHTHGGQIRFPLIGPIIAPSRFGGRYACGVFDEPPTVMHVSRGVSSMFPIRLRCPPELAKLTLVCA